MKKRGMLEVQFNWIFVLIVGALIILFFVKVVYSQKTISDRKLAEKVLNELTLLSVGAEVATSTASDVDMGGNIIGFDCYQCECEYYVKNLGESYSRNYYSRALFAPSEVRGERILTWALDWNMPYKVTNFLFITSPEIRHVFVSEGSDIDNSFLEVIRKLPDQINRGSRMDDIFALSGSPSMDDFNYRNEYMVKFIVFGDLDIEQLNTLINTPGMKNLHYSMISAVKIIPKGSTRDAEGNFRYIGRVEFYKVERNSRLFVFEDGSYYVGVTSLIGAMLVDNYYSYACPMEASLKRLKYVSTVYDKRVNELKSSLSEHEECRRTYNSASGYISENIQNIEATSNPSIGGYFSDGNPSWSNALENIYDNSFGLNGIEDLNDKVILFSCPEIF